MKDIRVFVGTDLVYNGTVEKGCGNQVFDYCQVISLKGSPKSSQETRKPENHSNKLEQEKPKPVARKQPPPPRDSRKVKELSDKSQVRRNNEVNLTSVNSNEINNSMEKGKGSNLHSNGKRSPSPASAPKYPSSLNSPRISPRERPNHRTISPSPNREHKKTLRSISMSSGSEASSGGESQPVPRQSPSIPSLDLPRSETRTLSHASHKLQRPNVGSDSENEETPRGK